MPLYPGADQAIRDQLARLEKGERVPLIVIGEFTTEQFAEINKARLAAELPPLAQNQIVFIGRHLYERRTRDGYSIEDILLQITSGLSCDAGAHLDKMSSALQNPKPRKDGYGNEVLDRAVFEMTARKPRAELFSIIPKGDTKKPKGRR